MPLKDQDEILTLLAISILVDKRLRDEEISAFCQEAQSLMREFKDQDLMPRTEFKRWLAAHKDSISRQLSGNNRNSYMSGAVNNILDPKLRKSILLSLFKLSVSDFNLHAHETELLLLCKNEWDIPLSDLTLS